MALYFSFEKIEGVLTMSVHGNYLTLIPVDIESAAKGACKGPEQ